MNLKMLASSMSLFQALTIIAFLYNQAVWIIEDHENRVGMTVSISWLAYDYMNALFHASSASLLSFYLSRK